MANKGILFDLYGTLIDIRTDEYLEEIYRGISQYLTYRGIYRHRGEVRDSYFRILKEQKAARGEEHPEIDVEAIWDTFLVREGMTDDRKRRRLSLVLAQLYRGLSRQRLELYPDVKQVLDELRATRRLALVSDAQPCYALPEIKAVGLDGYFDPVVISAPYGFRKPDRRLIEKALSLMGLTPAEVIFVGNDMYRDISGAKGLGIRTVFFDSNQGEKHHEQVSPDYIVHRFVELLRAVEALGG